MVVCYLISMEQRYKNFVADTNFFEARARTILQCLPACGNYAACLKNVEWGAEVIEINFFYPTGDYEDESFLIGVDTFLNRTAEDAAAAITNKRETDRIEALKKQEANYRKDKEAQFERLKIELGK